MTTSRSQIQVIIGVAILVFAVGIVATGGSANPKWLQFYSYAVLVAVVVVTLWDRWIWRWRVSQRFSRVPRDIGGTWGGTLSSQWKDPSTGKTPPPKPAYLVVRQTASSVSATMYTDEMRSRSSLGKVSGYDGMSSLEYMYLSRPDTSVEHRSRMHHGSTSLDIVGAPAKRLKGRYWTDRDSKGGLDFHQHVKWLADDYESAAELLK